MTLPGPSRWWGKWSPPILLITRIRANMSTVDNTSTFSFSYLWPSGILWNSAHAIGGSDEALRLRWNESCCFFYFISLEICIETCLLNARLVMDTKLNAMNIPSATNAWLNQVKYLKLAVSPHFELNISVRVMWSPCGKVIWVQFSTGVLSLMVEKEF
jgi:hypothetical protein